MLNKNNKKGSAHAKLINFIQWLTSQIQPLKLKKFRYFFGILLILNLFLQIVKQPFFCTLLYYLFFTTMFFSYLDTLFENQVLFDLREEKDTCKRLETLLKIEEYENAQKIKKLTEQKQQVQRKAHEPIKLLQDQLKKTKQELKNAQKTYEQHTQSDLTHSVFYLVKLKQQIKQLQQEKSDLVQQVRQLSCILTQGNQYQKIDIVSMIIQKFQKLQNTYLSQFKQPKHDNSFMVESQAMDTQSQNLNKQIWVKQMIEKCGDKKIQKIIDYYINTIKSIMLPLLRERKQYTGRIINYENSINRIKNILNNNFRQFTNSEQYMIQNNEDKVQGIINRIIQLFKYLTAYNESLGNASFMMNNKEEQIQRIVQSQAHNYQQMIYQLRNENEQLKIGYGQMIKKLEMDLQRLNNEKQKETKVPAKLTKITGKTTWQMNQKDPLKILKTQSVNKKYLQSIEITESDDY